MNVVQGGWRFFNSSDFMRLIVLILDFKNGDSVCGSMVVAEAAVLKGLFCLEAQIALSLR